MAGGMNGKRTDAWLAQERIHDAEPPDQPILPGPNDRRAPSRPPVRPCWVTDEHGRLPGLLLEWRRTGAGWQGRVVRPVLEVGSWIVVEEWMPAGLLKPGDPRDSGL